jgi:prophage regulatory protein
MSILRKPEVKSAFGMRSDSSVSNAVRDGVLTRPVQLGPRAVGWPDYEINAIGAARIAGRTNEDIRALVLRLHVNRARLDQS